MAPLLPPHLADAEPAALDPGTSPARLEKIFQALYPLGLARGASDALFDETRRLIWLIGQNPNAPPSVLKIIAAMSYLAARSVARNPGFSLALLADPLASGPDTQEMVRAVAQRWPSDDDIAAALRPLLEQAFYEPAARARVDAAAPALVDTYARFSTSRWPVRDALMAFLNPDPIDDHGRAPAGSCLMGRGWILGIDLLEAEMRLEAALAGPLGLGFTRWFPAF